MQIRAVSGDYHHSIPFLGIAAVEEPKTQEDVSQANNILTFTQSYFNNTYQVHSQIRDKIKNKQVCLIMNRPRIYQQPQSRIINILSQEESIDLQSSVTLSQKIINMSNQNGLYLEFILKPLYGQVNMLLLRLHTVEKPLLRFLIHPQKSKKKLAFNCP